MLGFVVMLRGYVLLNRKNNGWLMNGGMIQTAKVRDVKGKIL